MSKKDKRVKGCPNESCILFKSEKYSAEDRYCKSCGSELVLVCEKCFGPIDDYPNQRRTCEGCRLKAEEQKEKIIDTGKKAAAAVAAVGAIVAPFAKEGWKIAKKAIKR